MGKTPASEALQRALAFVRRTAELAADDARPVDGGWLIRAPSLADVWGLNHLRLSGSVTYARAVELAEQHLGELPYRQLVIEHEDSARRLEEPLGADGWTFDRDVLMALARPADHETDAGGVVEIQEDTASELMRQWISDDPKMTAAALDQLIDATAREARARTATHLGIRDETGDLVAMTKLYSDSVTAQVEDVYTVPVWRNRGCARRLITRAIALAREAGHEFVFIEADDNGWPKQLYSRLGFDPIGRIGVFHRDV
ncbi:MAG TPA: GNAT family N-acetyltransferase [Solirubrobacteraceae bacterium]|nr:GNAT family N-acetyltransferase [Solirubrobacteraceae bacterium]